jgi:hypothetical protein
MALHDICTVIYLFKATLRQRFKKSTRYGLCIGFLTFIINLNSPATGFLDLTNSLHGLIFDHTLPDRAKVAFEREVSDPAKRDFLADCIKDMVSKFA